MVSSVKPQIIFNFLIYFFFPLIILFCLFPPLAAVCVTVATRIPPISPFPFAERLETSYPRTLPTVFRFRYILRRYRLVFIRFKVEIDSPSSFCSRLCLSIPIVVNLSSFLLVYVSDAVLWFVHRMDFKFLCILCRVCKFDFKSKFVDWGWWILLQLSPLLLILM